MSVAAMRTFAGCTIAFRTDASLAIGAGHVMRCLTLADALAAEGARCRFISRVHPGHMLDAIRASGHDAVSLAAPPAAVAAGRQHKTTEYADWLGCDPASDAHLTCAALGESRCDWLVVDHYALDASWEATLRPACRRILAVDDLARTHDCDLLLDQNLGRVSADYASSVPPGCVVLAGPAYALLRPQFAALRDASLRRRRTSSKQVERLLVSLGGIDRDNATGTVLAALSAAPAALPATCRFSIVMGAQAPALDDVRFRAAQLPWEAEVQVAVADMAALMTACDLAIGAAGSTSWERCCLGLPALMLVLADNQVAIGAALEAAGAAVTVRRAVAGQFEARMLSDALVRVCEPGTLSRMSEAASAVTDGLGCHRVVRAMAEHAPA